jgi:hypothetical protein
MIQSKDNYLDLQVGITPCIFFLASLAVLFNGQRLPIPSVHIRKLLSSYWSTKPQLKPVGSVAEPVAAQLSDVFSNLFKLVRP